MKTWESSASLANSFIEVGRALWGMRFSTLKRVHGVESRCFQSLNKGLERRATKGTATGTGENQESVLSGDQRE